MKTRRLRRNKRTRSYRKNKKNYRKNKIIHHNSKKIYNMKGCYHKYNCNCHKKNGGSGPIGGLQIGSGVPGPFVGEPYNINDGGNYYGPEYKSGGFDYQRQMQLRGGGGIIPSNLLNVGRNIINEGKSVYNGVYGYDAPRSDFPWKDQGKIF